MNYDRVILGEGCVYSTNSEETQLNNNVLVCGSSGSGKTMSISEPCLLETVNSSLVITLSKRKLVKKYASLFKKRRYNVYELNFASPEESTVCYDPLEYINGYQDITFLAEAIVKINTGVESKRVDPYWDNASISLLSAEITYVLMTKGKASFADVLDLHESLEIRESSEGIKTSLDDKFLELKRQDPNNHAITCWKSFRDLPWRTAACIYGNLNTSLDTIFTPELREMMRKKKKINIEKIATEKSVLFITTSAVNPSLNCFINLFYSQLFKQLFEYAEKRTDGVLPIPVKVLADDFAVGSKIMNFPEYISVFREKRISVTLLVQSESQLESMYGREASTTIIDNCDTYVYLGGMDLNTAASISKRVNQPLDEVLYMPIGELILFRRGQRPIVTKRYNIFNNELYQKITKEHVFDIGWRK